jgi:hypothetical protein
MDMRISFISTSMIGFECIWTSIIMTLQIGTLIYLGSFSSVVDVGVDSGQHLCHIERTSRVLRDEGYFGLRFDHHLGPYLLVGLDPACVTTFSCHNALDLLFLIPCAYSAGLLCSNFDVVHHTPALVSCVMVYLNLYHRLVRR